ncbi:MAG: hypothetical protein Q8O67_21955 [Deltaproteobacteria bacterium]|nr:hypothetical protein [Deltaproteobacteria bacterium]
MTATTAPAPAAKPPVAKAPPGPVPSPTAKKLSQKTLKAKETRWDKRGAWFLAFITAFIVVGLWALSAFVIDAPPKGRGPQGDTLVGYTLGILTLVLYAGVAAYSMRHRKRIQKRFMTRTWMEAHLAFGLVAGLAAVLHSGPRLLAAAPLHGAFLIAWLLLIGSGIFGKIVSVVVPKRLTAIEDEALLAEDVTDKQIAMRKEIEDLLQANPDERFVAYANTVVPKAIKDPQSYGKRRMRRGQVVEEIWTQTNGASALPADKHETGKRIVTCLVEERFFEQMQGYHWILRAWVPIHVALTTLCFPWLIIHVITVFML